MTKSLLKANHLNKLGSFCYYSNARKIPPPPQNEKQKQMREEFWKRENVLESKVDYSVLSNEDRRIHEAHKTAVSDYHFTYDDPETGLKVITRLRHFLKGTCCGNACRHCVYDHENVDKELREKRIFNSAFWINKEIDEDDNDGGMMMAGEHNVSDADLEHFMNTILQLVKETGEIIANAIGTSGNVEIDEKEQNIGEGNASAILTETDLKVEKHLMNGLRLKYPDHQFIGEESTGDSGAELGDAPTWIIDPIDGTMNFVHSNPLVCTSIGLTVNKKLVLGVVHCPLIDKVYTAIKGKGAFCNGKQIKTSGVKDIGKAMMIMELPAGANQDKKDIAMENLKYMMDNAHAIRCPGPAAMDIAWIGAGSADAYFHQGIHSWDMAGGTIIVKEAGGSVLAPDGGEFDLMSRGVIVAASNELANQVVKFIKLYPSPRDQLTPVHPFQ